MPYKETNQQILDNFISLGYTKEIFIKMTKGLPNLYEYSFEKNITRKFNGLIDLGYSKEEVIKITCSFPMIYSYSMERIKNRFKELMDLGYTKEVVLKMTASLPALFGYNYDGIKEKIDYLNEINLGFVVTENTKQLVQSVELTYARYEFLREIKKEVTQKNYTILFRREISFQKQFNITKQKLLEKYKYKDYLEAKNGRTL